MYAVLKNAPQQEKSSADDDANFDLDAATSESLAFDGGLLVSSDKEAEI